MKSGLSLNLLRRQRFNFWLPILLVTIFIVGAFLRFYRIGKRSFYCDEVLILDIISQTSVKDILQKVKLDFNPDLPFYYILLHYWSYLGKNPFWLRALSAITGLLLLIAAYKFTKYLFDKKTALLVFYLVSFSPFLVLYSQTSRYYSFNGLINLLTLYFFIKAVHNKHIYKWLFYALLRAASIYLNYSSFLFFFTEVFFIFLYRKKYPLSFKRWELCLFLIFLLWLPMASYLYRGLRLLLIGEGFEGIPFRLGWIGNLFYSFFSFGLGNTVSPFNYPVILIAGFIYIFLFVIFFKSFLLKKIPQESSVFIILILFIPTILCAIPAYNMPRNIIASAIPYLSTVSLGILQTKRMFRVIPIIILSLLGIYSLFNLYNGRQYQHMEFIDHWDGIASYAVNHSLPEDIIIYDSFALTYYLNSVKRAYEFPNTEEDMRIFLAETLGNKKISKILLLDSPLSGKKITSYRKEEFDLLNAWLKENNFKLSDIKNFDRDPDAIKKRRFINRPFPEYRTSIYIYSKEN